LFISANALLLLCALVQQGKEEFNWKSCSMHSFACHCKQTIFLQILLLSLGLKVKIVFSPLSYKTKLSYTCKRAKGERIGV